MKRFSNILFYIFADAKFLRIIIKVDSQQKGGISEAKIYSALTCAGYKVVFPDDARRWDIGYEQGRELIKIQCKTGRVRGNTIVFNITSRSRDGKHRGYETSVDFFAVYCFELNKVYLIPIGIIKPKYECVLRLSAPLNGQDCKVPWAKDYELT